MCQRLSLHLPTMPFLVAIASMWMMGVPEHAQAFDYFAERLPNGDRVRSPCLPIIAVPAFGHKYPGGGGPRNDFGKDFEANGFQWTEQLCKADSDKDGLRNGLELGDPTCKWTPGDEPSRQFRITHPGINNWNAKCFLRLLIWLRGQHHKPGTNQAVTTT